MHIFLLLNNMEIALTTCAKLFSSPQNTCWKSGQNDVQKLPGLEGLRTEDQKLAIHT